MRISKISLYFIILRVRVRKVIWGYKNLVIGYWVRHRCRKSRYGILLWGRFIRFRKMQNNRVRKERRERNMEVMVKVSEEYGIPQYKIRDIFEVDGIGWK